MVKFSWLGGFISPEAYLTSERQSVAQELKVPLDELGLPITISEIPNINYVIKRLCIEGSEWNYPKNKLIITDNFFSQLPFFMIKQSINDENIMNNMFPIPVSNNMRKNL